MGAIPASPETSARQAAARTLAIIMKQALLTLLALATLSAAPAKQTFIGVVTDEMCANKAGHASMHMGPTDAECTRACVDLHGAAFVLYDGKTAYRLSDVKKADAFAGQKVRVTGTLDVKKSTIQMTAISAAR